LFDTNTRDSPGEGRSAWNAADIRGEVEHHLARTGIATDAAVRRELAEDLTARSIDRCVALLDRDGVPENIRALTSLSVLQIENDLGGLAVRGAQSGHDLAVPAMAAAAERSRAYLNAGQAAAVATLAGPKGKRDLPVEDVMLGPRKLALTKGEIIVSFLLPPRPARSSDAYLRFIPRTEMDIAVVGSGVSLTLDGGGTITAARVSLGAVAARVLLVQEAAQAIIGSRLDKAAQDRLEAAARAACRPIDDKRGTTEFRIDVAAVLTRRAALIALDRARTS